MTAAPVCEKLDWDSQFFGASIARALPTAADGATCATMLNWCAAHAIDCLYFLCPSDDEETAATLERAGFDLVDVRVTFQRALASARERCLAGDTAAPIVIRAADPGDIPALRAIASVSHRDTRFYRDGRFAAARCDELYATWIERSCRGYADHVLVADGDGAAAGYLSLHLEAGGARIGLLGVAASWRRRGVGRSLLDAAFDWLAARDVHAVSVVTPGGNLAAQALYRSRGFEESDRRLWYHRWFPSRARVTPAL
jgi:dTDP-4-amino-4,6-dideoxy-D-galactose acyltransferase